MYAATPGIRTLRLSTRSGCHARSASVRGAMRHMLEISLHEPNLKYPAGKGRSERRTSICFIGLLQPSTALMQRMWFEQTGNVWLNGACICWSSPSQHGIAFACSYNFHPLEAPFASLAPLGYSFCSLRGGGGSRLF
eukprot:1154661-Pelagomonas_calceolata.AAC.1